MQNEKRDRGKYDTTLGPLIFQSKLVTTKIELSLSGKKDIYGEWRVETRNDVFDTNKKPM